MRKLLLLMIVGLLLAPQWASVAKADELVVYTARKEYLVKPLFDAYTEKTGIAIKYATDKAGALLQRLKAEDSNSPADVLITVDAGNLWQAANEGLLQPIRSDVLEKNVPSHLRDTDNKWFGLSVRARTIVYSTQRVNPSKLSTYEELASPRWKGRLCLRTSKKVYNQSLVAMMIAKHGEQKTEDIVRGWVDNLARKPFSNDTKVMKAIEAGLCDLGVINTYYFGRLQQKNPDIKLAIFWPNQKGSGVHVNVSGAGVTRYAKHKKEAVKFIEWLSSTEAQSMFADANMEYPVNPKTEPHEFVKSWGEFKGNTINVSKAGSLQADAIRLMDRAGFR